MVWFAVAATAASALSQRQQAQQQSQQSMVNAALVDEQAKTAALQTGSQVSQIRNQGSKVLSEQSANFAENGTGTGGSNALIQRSSAIDTELDAMNANNNGQQQIVNLQNQAQAYRTAAKQQKPGLLSLLGGASQVGSAYASTKK